MKKEISPAAIAGIVVVVVAVIGLLAYKTFGGDPAAGHASPEQVKAIAKIKAKLMAPGVHRDANGHPVDANGKPIDMSASGPGQ